MPHCDVPVQVEMVYMLEASLPTTDTSTQYIYFVRHGESEVNAAQPKVTCGKSLQVKLTEEGIQQAQVLGKLLREKLAGRQVVIVSSTAVRAQQTARELFATMKGKVDVYYSEDDSFEGFCELGQGVWEGVIKNHPQYASELKTWENLAPYDRYIMPKASTCETYEQVGERFLQDLHQVKAAYPEATIIIATHFAAMNAIQMRLNVKDWASEPKFPEINFHNCDMLLYKCDQNDIADEGCITTHFSSHKQSR